MKAAYWTFSIYVAMICIVSVRSFGESIFTVSTQKIFRDTNQLAVLDALAARNYHEADKLLLTLPIDKGGTNGGTILWWQVNIGDFDSFVYLIKKGANLNMNVSDSENTMELCSLQTDSRFLQYAIEHGGKVNLIGLHSRQTPVYAAISGRNNTNVQMLVSHGALLSIEGSAGETPLLWAAMSKNFEAIEILLNAGANPDVADSLGRRPLDILQAMRLPADSPLLDSYKRALHALEAKKRGATK